MEYSEKIKVLTLNLKKSEKVNSFDSAAEGESATLAHAFADIEESCNVLTKELFPKLMLKEISNIEVDELLFEIGEEFRHILYHIKDPRYFEYLTEEI